MPACILTQPQFNAIQDRASSGNIYGDSWLGPQPSTFNLTDQTAALHGLINAALVPFEASQGKPDPNPKRTPVGAIIGGVIGGLAVICACIAVLFFVRKRRRRSHVQELDLDEEPAIVEPFTVEKETASPVIRPSTKSQTPPSQRNNRRSSDSGQSSSRNRAGIPGVDEIVRLVTERIRGTQDQQVALPPPAYSTRSRQSSDDEHIGSSRVGPGPSNGGRGRNEKRD
jgi:hypothetical protein